MAFTAEPQIGTAPTGGLLDQVLELAWSVSEIAVNVLGPFFWAALAALSLQAIG